jgi:hypothetical protein
MKLIISCILTLIVGETPVMGFFGAPAVRIPDSWELLRNPQMGRLKWGHFLNDTVFRKFASVSILQCVSECLRRSNCLSINYNRNYLSCDLNEGNSTTHSANIEARSGYAHSDIATWSKVRVILFCLEKRLLYILKLHYYF